jgi:hypothetical protein
MGGIYMTDDAAKREHEHWIHYTLDDEPESTIAKILTPVQIMTDAGIDAQTNYLEQILGHEFKSYKDNPNEQIEMKNGMRFLTKPTGPMPVS